MTNINTFLYKIEMFKKLDPGITKQKQKKKKKRTVIKVEQR